jgi:peptidoglycan L-alanyl-D-glutamate endopeptidase CwlK
MTARAPAPLAPIDAGLLTERDRQRLKGVRADLRMVVELARKSCPFIVVEGLRTEARQKVLVATGKSLTLKSKHLLGHAVDVAPLVRGVLSWDAADFRPLAAAMEEAAARLGVRIEWGGRWRKLVDCPHFELVDASNPASVAHARALAAAGGVPA